MDIKLKNGKPSKFIIVFLTIICSLVLSCKSSSLEGTVFNKIVHSREYIFDISDIEEYPKLKRERGSKKLIYTVDFTDFVKYDMPKAGDKLTIKYRGFPNKDIPGAITVNVAGLPAGQSESFIFASELIKKQIFESQVSFVLKQDLEEVKFNLKYDNPKSYFSVVLELEKVADTTDTKAEKKALERAIKHGQQIVEVATFGQQQPVPAEVTPTEQIEKDNIIEETPSAEAVSEEPSAPVVKTEGDSNTEPALRPATQTRFYSRISTKDIKDRPYYKLSHPRMYFFDINKIDQYPKLKKVKGSDKLHYTVDFTSLAKEDMPKAGDKIVIISEGYATKDVPGNIYASLDTADSDKVVFSTGLKEKETFRQKVSFVLDKDLDKVKLNLEYDNPNDNSSIYMKMNQAIFSTDTGEELKNYRKALRQGRKVIEWTQTIVDDYAVQQPVSEITEEPEEPEVPAPEPQPEEQAVVEQEQAPVVPEPENIQAVVPLPVVTPEPEVKQEAVEEPKEEIQEPEQEEQQDEEVPAVVETPAPAPEKTPEDILEEERRKLEEQQRQLKEEQAKLEAEKAKFAAEAKARQEAEAARLAKEAEEKAKRQEWEKQEEERLKQQQMLEETIEAVTNTNVKRYEKEYLNDYAVSGYTFDMEQEQQQSTQIFENPNEINKFGTTLLMDAAKDGNDWKIKALITSGADVNLKDKDGWTALMYAVRYNGNMNCVELLIDAGADVKAVNNYGTSPLILAANYNNNPEILKKLLGYYSPNEKDVLTSFIQVLTENQDDEYMQVIKVNMFLDMSVPLNSLYNGKTPLMYAAESGSSTKVIKMLMENSNTAIRSREGKTAFDYAKENPKLKHDDIYWSLNSK